MSTIIGFFLVAVATSASVRLVFPWRSVAEPRQSNWKLTEHSLGPSDSNRDELKKYSYCRIQMAMPMRITVWCQSQQKAEEACVKAFDHAAKLEKIFSNYQSNSEVRGLTRKEIDTPIQVSDHLLRVLQFSKEMFSQSKGAFDPTAAPVIELWKESHKTGQLPNAQVVQSRLQQVGFEKIEIDNEASSVSLLMRNLSLDFGGVAKGYIGDEVLRILHSEGISIACYEAGGDFVLGDQPPGSSGWTIDIGKDSNGDPKTVSLNNCGVSTSGDSVQFVEVGGRRYSHVIDPRTGIGVTNRKRTVVAASSGMESDALATVGCVLSEQEFQRVARHFQARFVWVESCKVTSNGQVEEKRLRKLPLK